MFELALNTWYIQFFIQRHWRLYRHAKMPNGLIFWTKIDLIFFEQIMIQSCFAQRSSPYQRPLKAWNDILSGTSSGWEKQSNLSLFQKFFNQFLHKALLCMGLFCYCRAQSFAIIYMFEILECTDFGFEIFLLQSYISKHTTLQYLITYRFLHRPNPFPHRVVSALFFLLLLFFLLFYGLSISQYSCFLVMSAFGHTSIGSPHD